MKVTMRKSEMQLGEEETLQLVEKSEYGVLSMCTVDNGAYGIPLNYVYMNDKIYIHGAMQGTKLSVMRANPRVSFCIVGWTRLIPEKVTSYYKSAIVYGEATEITDDQERHDAMVGFVGKYCPNHLDIGMESIRNNIRKTAIFGIVISEITGKHKTT